MTGRPVNMDRVDGRVRACAEDVATRPFSHPIAVGWYAEDVPVLAAELVAVRADLAEAKERLDVEHARGYREGAERERAARGAAEQERDEALARAVTTEQAKAALDLRFKLEAAEADNQRLLDAQHWTRRMLQALDIYWEHYEGLSHKKSLTVRSESCSEDWWHRFEKYRARVEAALAGAAAATEDTPA